MKKLFLKKCQRLSPYILPLLCCSFFTPITGNKISTLDSLEKLFSMIISPDKEQALTVANRTKTNNVSKNKKKPWTLVVYMAADNDLRNFAARNIKQLAEIGSNQFINILVHVDIKIAGNNKITRRYYIEKNQVIHVNANDPLTQQMDSGDPKTLVSCCAWAFENYPADNYALILWNHGTGCLDPQRGRVFNPIDLFSYNPLINKFELDRSINFIDFIDDKQEQRGICWDDSTGNYLTNQKLELALKTITQTILKGQKLSLLGFDACLMSMIEVGNLVRPYAHLMCGSQEVELGAGWNYSTALAPFATQTISKEELAENIVNMYAQAYSQITHDFTQSAVDLNALDKLENIIHNIALILSEALQKQTGNSVKKALWLSHSKAYCTSFDEPGYKDIHHFFCNLQTNLNQFQLSKKEDEMNLKNNLNALLIKGKQCLEQVIFANRVGKNLSKARGLSIYFPEQKIHPSYQHTNFAAKNAWYAFLKQYLNA